MTSLMRITNDTKTIPYKSWLPDLSTKGGPLSPVGARGLLGAFQQPAEYIGRYAWKYYEGDRKTRALAQYGYYHGRRYVINKVLKHGSSWYQYRAKTKKNGLQWPKSSNPKFQKGAERRTNNQSVQYYNKSKPCKRGRFGSCRPNWSYRRRRTYRMCN